MAAGATCPASGAREAAVGRLAGLRSGRRGRPGPAGLELGRDIRQ